MITITISTLAEIRFTVDFDYCKHYHGHIRIFRQNIITLNTAEHSHNNVTKPSLKQEAIALNTPQCNSNPLYLDIQGWPKFLPVPLKNKPSMKSSVFRHSYWSCNFSQYWPFVLGIHRPMSVSQRNVSWNFGVFLVVSLNKLLIRQSICSDLKRNLIYVKYLPFSKNVLQQSISYGSCIFVPLTTLSLLERHRVWNHRKLGC